MTLPNSLYCCEYIIAELLSKASNRDNRLSRVVCIYIYIYIPVTVNSAHLDCTIATALRQQKGQPGANQCSPAALYSHEMPNPRCAFCHARHPGCMSDYSLYLATAMVVTALTRMAQTPYASPSGGAPLQVLERIPHSSCHMLSLTTAPPRPVHAVIPSPYTA